MNRNERRSWDRYVAEAREVKSEMDLPDGNAITVYIPNADQVTALNDAEQRGDIWGQLDALLGDENSAKLREVAKDAPVTALMTWLRDVLSDLGLIEVRTAGNSRPSSS